MLQRAAGKRPKAGEIPLVSGVPRCDWGKNGIMRPLLIPAVGIFPITRGREEVKLSPREFRLLQMFAKRPGQALTRDEILNCVWGCDSFVGLAPATAS